jgi:hypothetical protein
MECLFLRSAAYLSYTPCIGGVAAGLQVRSEIEVEFFT